MLVMTAFMTLMIAQIMGPVAIMIVAVVMLAQFSIAVPLSEVSAFTIAEVPFIVATIAPVTVFTAVKMPVGGDPILMFSC